MGIAERNLKYATPFLEPGEDARASCVVQLKGNQGALMAFGALGALLSGVFNKKRVQEAEAAGLPVGAFGSNLVVTDRRIIILKGKKLVTSVAGAQVRSAEVIGGTINAVLRLDMASGQSVELTASKVLKPDAFVAAVNALASGSGATPPPPPPS